MIKYFQYTFLFISLLVSITEAQQYNWKLVNSPSGLRVDYLAVDPITTNVVACTGNGIYLSSNNGKSWSRKGSNVKVLRNNISCAAIRGDTIIVCLDGDSYHSTDAGTSWTNERPDAQPSDLQGIAIFAISYLNDGRLIIGTSNGIYLSTNLGVTWSQSGLASALIRNLYLANGFLFAITQKGLYTSTDNGNSWSIRAKTSQDSLLVKDSLITDITYSPIDSILYLCSENKGLYKSTNRGASWDSVTNENALKAYVNDKLFILSTASGKILRSSDGGHTWNTVHNGFLASNFTPSGKTILYGDNNGVWRSIDQGNTWLFNNQGLNSVTYASLTAPSGLLTLTANGMQRSTDYGNTWQNTHVTPTTTLGLIQTDNGYYATTADTIFHSNDEGITWNSIGNQIAAGIAFYNIAVNRDTFFAIGYDYTAQHYAIYKSINRGKEWSDAGLSLTEDDPSQILAFHDTIYVLGISNNFGATSHIFRTLNNGVDWQTIPVNNDGVFSLIPYKGRIFVGTDDGVYPLESDTIGNALSPHSLLAVRFFSDGKSLFATTPQGVYTYQDSDTSWKNVGPQNQDMTVITGKDGKLFAFTRIGDLYMTDLTNSVNKQEEVSPIFSLSVSATHKSSIEFNMISTASGQMDLKIFDDLGRQRGESIRREITPGIQKIVFPTNILKSGVFFYTALFHNTKCSGKFISVE